MRASSIRIEVHLVDDREVERSLHLLVALVLHVVAQVIEAELVVGAVSHVGGISLAPLGFAEVGHDDADRQAEELVDPAHPFGVALGEIIVDSDDVDALALDGVEVSRQRGDEGLALAGLHLGNFAAVKHDAADQLHVEMPHAEDADRGLTHSGESFGQDVVERLAVGQLVAELLRLRLQLGVAERLDLRFERVDGGDGSVERLDVAVVGRPENGFGNRAEHDEFLML